ncbi:hypothetical protein PG993_013735 [Apiospora rasikravindrae]|uniref:Uncharacterized protein n=1 Tax=Apiospora rasikravindrae TaxID=990691 RepID=A0ABR1RR27_9PEZI
MAEDAMAPSEATSRINFRPIIFLYPNDYAEPWISLSKGDFLDYVRRKHRVSSLQQLECMNPSEPNSQTVAPLNVYYQASLLNGRPEGSCAGCSDRGPRPGCDGPHTHIIRQIQARDLPDTHLGESHHELFPGLVLYLQSIPPYMLSPVFWSWLAASGDEETYASARGFMRTWTLLVQTEKDFDLATSGRWGNVIPRKVITPTAFEASGTDADTAEEFTFESFMGFVSQFAHDRLPDSDVAPRYTYGELKQQQLEPDGGCQWMVERLAGKPKLQTSDDNDSRELEPLGPAGEDGDEVQVEAKCDRGCQCDLLRVRATPTKTKGEIVDDIVNGSFCGLQLWTIVLCSWDKAPWVLKYLLLGPMAISATLFSLMVMSRIVRLVGISLFSESKPEEKEPAERGKTEEPVSKSDPARTYDSNKKFDAGLEPPAGATAAFMQVSGLPVLWCWQGAPWPLRWFTLAPLGVVAVSTVLDLLLKIENWMIGKKTKLTALFLQEETQTEDEKEKLVPLLGSSDDRRDDGNTNSIREWPCLRPVPGDILAALFTIDLMTWAVAIWQWRGASELLRQFLLGPLAAFAVTSLLLLFVQIPQWSFDGMTPRRGARNVEETEAWKEPKFPKTYGSCDMV